MTDRFCPLPWTNLSTDVNGSLRPCCRYSQPGRQKEKMPWMKDGIQNGFNSSAMRNLRQAFIDGKQPDGCNWCWREEDVGVKSYRQTYILKYPEIINRYDFNKNISDQPATIDFKLSNVCNFKCRMCSPMASSLIAKEQNKQDPYWLTNKIIGTDNEDVFFRWLPQIDVIELTGGEPFVSPENKELLLKIIHSGYADHIGLHLTTNGSTIRKDWIKILSSFKHVAVSLSIDDIGPRLEYARKGAKWDKIRSNCIKFNELYETFVYITINNFNVYYLEEIEKHFIDMGITVTMGLLHEPEWLSIKHLPANVKDKIAEKIPGFKDVISFMGTSDHSLRNRFLLETKKLDTRREESFEEVFEELAELIYEK